jgi:hypothetical protein
MHSRLLAQVTDGFAIAQVDRFSCADVTDGFAIALVEVQTLFLRAFSSSL